MTDTEHKTPPRELPARAVGPDDPLPNVKNVVLVMSGKGGVGKSSVACNLAMALSRAGWRTGLLDADIYGPSIPTMLGVSGRPVSADGKTIEPLATIQCDQFPKCRNYVIDPIASRRERDATES